MTFGAATSVLLTGVKDTFAVRRNKNGMRTGRNSRNPEREIDELSVVPQGVSTYSTVLTSGHGITFLIEYATT